MTAPEPRRVLIATVDMTAARGTAVYTRDLALALLRHGWLPIVYSTRLGAAAETLRLASIPVVSSLDTIGSPPDVIHGQHVMETLVALARFPNVPAIWVGHDATTWHSLPPRTPRIRAYVAVDRNCRDRMVYQHAIDAASVRVLTNPVDLARLQRRGPLPLKPRRALVFSNQAAENTFAVPIRAACAQRGIEVDLAGEGSGRIVEPESVLPQYDLVFAKARCAIEAAAVGAAVIGCDHRGMSGMITSARLEELRQLNFGLRTLQLPVTEENLLREIDRYDAADAAIVTDRIRASHDSDLLAEQMIAVYEEALDGPADVSPRDDLEGIAATLGEVTPRLYAQADTVAGGTSMRLRTALLNSKALAGPVRLAWRLKKRLLR